MEPWTPEDSAELYDVPRWSNGYFSVAPDGHLLVHPERDTNRSIDLKALVDRLRMRGLELPVLLRFNGVLKDRVDQLHRAFATAIEENEYSGKYTCVYPIKVNQQREVVREIVEYGRRYGFGLEAGSKPELLAVVAMTDAEAPIVCNGFKDDEFIRMAMLAQKIGRTVIPVVERPDDLDLILHHAKEVGVHPRLGIRVKLASQGSGRWQSSGGYRSKFGLTVSELLQAVRKLEDRGMSDCFKLLHFHLGSQLTNIRHLKEAINEAVRVYADLHRRSASLQYFDIGGGLGVDYDGSQTNSESSMNYTLQEYANNVVYHIQTVCDEVGVPHPTIISESGRAIAAYHSVLVFGTLGATAQGEVPEIPESIPEDYEQPLVDLLETYQETTAENLIESYHDAQEEFENALRVFSTGHLTLERRVMAENLFFATCKKIQILAGEADYVSEELVGLDRMLSDTYYCNFSLFQSIPDSWAIKQLFPVMPIHRLNERPTRHSVLSDITCDSDGKIDQFTNRRDVRKTLMLHPFDGTPYYMGAFLVGAYQEILGDLHNLFGDSHAVHVDLSDSGEVIIDAIVKGDTVSEVLSYVEFDERELISRLQQAVEAAVRAGRIDHREAGQFVKFYESALHGYTYLGTAIQPDA